MSSDGGEGFYGDGEFVGGVGFCQIEGEVAAMVVVAGEDDHAIKGAGVAHVLRLMADNEEIDLPEVSQGFERGCVVPAIPAEGAKREVAIHVQGCKFFIQNLVVEGFETARGG